jgi:hypothetical protein
VFYVLKNINSLELTKNSIAWKNNALFAFFSLMWFFATTQITGKQAFEFNKFMQVNAFIILSYCDSLNFSNFTDFN